MTDTTQPAEFMATVLLLTPPMSEAGLFLGDIVRCIDAADDEEFYTVLLPKGRTCPVTTDNVEWFADVAR